MLVVEKNQYMFTWTIGSNLTPLNYHGELVVAFDPSKTNMAVVIGTPTGEVLNNIEFSGNNRGRGPTMDTTQYCLEVREFLRQYIGHCNVYLAATEATIEKKGTEYYRSNLVLTEIRANILNFFSEQFNIKCVEVNNWTWKHAILPDGFRGQSEKGSKRFFETFFPELGYHQYFKADTTDVMCIYWYLMRTMCKSYSLLCNRTEPCHVQYDYKIIPTGSKVLAADMEVVFNDRFSLEDNLAFYANRIMVRFAMEIPVSKLTVDNIYGHAVFFKITDVNSDTVRLVVYRCRC